MENSKNSMPQNKTESPPKPPRSLGPRAQSPNSVYARTPTMQDLPRHPGCERFGVTPESMGLVRRSDIPTASQQQQEVEIQSNGKQYSKQSLSSPKPIMQQQLNSGINQSFPVKTTESNLYSSIQPSTNNISQTPSTSNYSSMNSENLKQHINNSPNSKTQQWNFDKTQHNSSSFNQTTVPTSPPTGHSNLYNCGNLPNPRDSEQPILSTEKCILNTKPITSSTLKTTGQINTTTGVAPISPLADNPPVLQNSKSFSEILPTSYYEEQLQKYRSGSDVSMGGTARMNGFINDMFLRRLQEIDAEAQGDRDLKLLTYQEWVDNLLKVNDSIITNMEELESEVAERLELVQRKVNTNCRHSQGNELMKSRKDIETLIKIIQNVRQYNNWDMQGLTLETITMAQVLGCTEQQLEKRNSEGGGCGGGIQMRGSFDSDSMHNHKLLANIKALAFEVAEKHDDVRELKRQMVCMEEEIQKAQKKIQLKDDVIKELRSDLKCAHNKLDHRDSLECNSGMAPINLENQTSRCATPQFDCNQEFSDYNISQLDYLSQSQLEEEQTIKVLSNELTELFNNIHSNNQQKMEKTMEIFKKLESEKAAAYRKLDYIRHQLINLESSNSDGINDCDSGFHSKMDYEQDAKILNSLRNRLHKLDVNNFELKERIQKLELEKNVLSTNLITEKNISRRTSETLKQLADLLSNMRGEQFSYTDIYNCSPNEKNPFCEKVIQISKDYQERERKLMQALGNSNRKIEEISQSLLSNEKQEQQEARVNIIDLEHLYKTTLPPRTPPPPIPTTTSAATSELPPPTSSPSPSPSSTLLTDLVQQQTTTSSALQGSSIEDNK